MTIEELEKRQHAICRALAMIRYLISQERIGDKWKLAELIDEAVSPHINLDKYIDNEGNMSTPMEKVNNENDLKTAIILGDESIITLAARKMRLAVLKEATKMICEKCRNNERITFIIDQGYYHDRHYCPASDIHHVIDKETL